MPLVRSHSPRGLVRLLLRLPIWLYRARLGWLLGHRFLLLTHVGRKTGLLHQTVLEVVHYDKATNSYMVASGWGEKSDWLRNVEKTSTVFINIGGQRFEATATRSRSPKHNTYCWIMPTTIRLPFAPWPS